jgi:hypothetical protein
MSTPSLTSEYLLLFRNTSWHKDLSTEEIQQSMARFTAFERLSNDGVAKNRNRSNRAVAPFLDLLQVVYAIMQMYKFSTGLRM